MSRWLSISLVGAVLVGSVVMASAQVSLRPNTLDPANPHGSFVITGPSGQPQGFLEYRNPSQPQQGFTVYDQALRPQGTIQPVNPYAPHQGWEVRPWGR